MITAAEQAATKHRALVAVGCTSTRDVVDSWRGHTIHEVVEQWGQPHTSRNVEAVGGIGAEEFQAMNLAMQRLDRFWNDTILYRL